MLEFIAPHGGGPIQNEGEVERKGLRFLGRSRVEINLDDDFCSGFAKDGFFFSGGGESKDFNGSRQPRGSQQRGDP